MLASNLLDVPADYFRWVIAGLAALNAGSYVWLVRDVRAWTTIAEERRRAVVGLLLVVALFTGMNAFGRVKAIRTDSPFDWQDFVWLGANVFAILVSRAVARAETLPRRSRREAP